MSRLHTVPLLGILTIAGVLESGSLGDEGCTATVEACYDAS